MKREVPSTIRAILDAENLDPASPPEAEAEAAARVAAPGVDDPMLRAAHAVTLSPAAATHDRRVIEPVAPPR